MVDGQHEAFQVFEDRRKSLQAPGEIGLGVLRKNRSDFSVECGKIQLSEYMTPLLFWQRFLMLVHDAIP